MRAKRIGYVGLRTDDVVGMTSFSLGEFAWFFVRAPDGRVFGIEQVPN